MCIGLPMRVVEPEGSHAWCEAEGQRERLDMMLVGDQAVGSWVLAFQGTARQVMSEPEAAAALAARRALAAVLNGEDCFDEFFSDLVGREPRLPDHLLPVLSEHRRP